MSKCFRLFVRYNIKQKSKENNIQDIKKKIKKMKKKEK